MSGQFHQLIFLGALIVTVALGAVACSSSPGVTPATVDGNYTVERYDFQPAGFDTRINVRDSLDLINMEVFGQDQEFLLRYRFPEEGTSRVRGSTSTQGNTAQFNVEQGNAARILLPGDTFPMRIRNDGDLLTLETTREHVDLRPFGIPQSSVDGTLTVRLQRE